MKARGVRKLRSRSAPPPLVAAVRGQLRIRSALRASLGNGGHGQGE
jgi:hypothetical protein